MDTLGTRSSGAYYISNGATGHWVTTFMADAVPTAPERPAAPAPSAAAQLKCLFCSASLIQVTRIQTVIVINHINKQRLDTD